MLGTLFNIYPSVFTFKMQWLWHWVFQILWAIYSGLLLNIFPAAHTAGENITHTLSDVFQALGPDFALFSTHPTSFSRQLNVLITRSMAAYCLGSVLAPYQYLPCLFCKPSDVGCKLLKLVLGFAIKSGTSQTQPFRAWKCVDFLALKMKY